MGCTTSAPNTIPLNASTADKSIQFEEETNENPSIEVDVADIEDENRTNETKVLPSCDTTEETVQLARNNKSTNSLTSDKDVPTNGHIIEGEDVTEATNNEDDEVKIPKLELLMDKVFETNHHLNGSDHKLNHLIKSDEDPPTESKEEAESAANNDEEAETNTEPESTDNGNEENKAEEGDEGTKEASPSQSQSSRATRWEALADIAAELPPSLAVDPITGQIYQIALSK